jgi:putative ABC transport system ATP-binding protein
MATQGVNMIELNGVCLTLSSGAGPVEILRGVDLSVPAGAAVGLVGPSGSGKSTLMAVMAGLERPGSGSVRVGGQELTTMGEDDLAAFRRDNIGIVFQSFHLIPAMTALENVAVPLELVGAPDAFDRAAQGLASVGLDQRLEHYPAQLSGGEQQRVALARAMACEPKLILADEPTGNLDGETGQAIIDLLFDMHDRHGTTLVLITHDQELAGRCDEVVTMADGRIVSAARNAAA